MDLRRDVGPTLATLDVATAIELGVQLVPKDRRMRTHRRPKPIAVW